MSSRCDAATELETLVLKYGAHQTRDDGMCIMEAVAWAAGEPHSDAPSCACPVIASFARRLNDRISDDAMRTRIMRPLVMLLLNTRASRANMVKRAYIAADFAAREAAPVALEARGFRDWAAKCRELAPLTDRETAKAAEKVLRADAAASAYAYAAYADAYAAAAYAADAAAAYAADAADAYADAYAAADAAAAAERIRQADALIALLEAA